MMDRIQAKPINQAINAPIQYHIEAHLLWPLLVIPAFHPAFQLGRSLKQYEILNNYT
jgi:hypothetical protein